MTRESVLADLYGILTTVKYELVLNNFLNLFVGKRCQVRLYVCSLQTFVCGPCRDDVLEVFVNHLGPVNYPLHLLIFEIVVDICMEFFPILDFSGLRRTKFPCLHDSSVRFPSSVDAHNSNRESKGS